MTDCIFCKIVSGDVPSRRVYSDDHAYAFLDLAQPDLTTAVRALQEQHQADAAHCAVAFEHFAVTTGTASGKTLCFHLAAMEAGLRTGWVESVQILARA